MHTWHEVRNFAWHRYTENFSPAPAPVSIDISVLCEISDLLLFVSYFASQNKGIFDQKFGDDFFDVCCEN